MSASLLSDQVYKDALIDFDSYSRPDPEIDASVTKNNVNNALTKLPNYTASRMEFKVPQPSQPITVAGSNNSKIPSLSDINFRLLQTKLAINEEKYKLKTVKNKIQKNDRPLYYQPPSSSVKNIYNEIKDCLPPNIDFDEYKKPSSTTKFKIPKLYNYETTQKTHDYNDVIQSIKNELENDDLTAYSPQYDNPTDDWVSPVVKEAIARQIDLEYYMKVFIRNILYLLIILLFKSLIKKVLVLYELKLKSQPLYMQMMKSNVGAKTSLSDSSLVDNFYFILIGRLICLPSIINILYSCITLVKGQDQCWDLPLSTKQRKLIGLNYKDKHDGSIDIDEEAELTLKQRRYDSDHIIPYKPIPKYNKVGDYTNFKIGTPIIGNGNQQSMYSARKSITDLDYSKSVLNRQFLQNNQQTHLRQRQNIANENKASDSLSSSTSTLSSSSRYSLNNIAKAHTEFFKKL
ncbi:hypothetical protein KGF54_004951 [Candida jiufengensis]|uniref:uncharacterized protein n=1 Tax=Candida jiufengensis TaxID=497108 RepID=UPI00222455E3|nr:uncharacterized protein KGF54_004951 [Candida jiufengensis]KAI5951876.1 hypothetical protein KGF54_004951 [Candida jiufengensis]